MVGYTAVAYLFFAFFLSGFAALTYQVTWSRVLAQAVGMDALSLVVVIAVFLGGMAAGAIAAEKVLPKLERPILWFFVLELTLSLFGFFSDTILRRVAHWSDGLDVGGFSFSSHLVDFCVQAVVLALPTMCMGAALPLVLAGSFGKKSPGQLLANLYAIATLGGAAGAFWAGIYSLGAFGIRTTLWSASSIQCFVALLSLLLWKKGALSQAAQAPESVLEIPKQGRRAWLPFYFWVFFAGYVALSYQVLYFRVATYFLSSTTYVAPVVLSSYLLLLAIGYWVSSRSSNRAILEGWVLCAIGTTSILFFLPYLFYYFNVPFQRFTLAAGSGWWVIFRSLLGCLVAFLPVIFLAGLFPALYGEATKGQSPGIRYAGRFLFIQALGNLAGALLTVLWLLPRLGTVGCFRLNIGMLGVLGIGLTQGNRREKMVKVAVLGAVALLTFQVVKPDFPFLFADVIWQKPEAVSEDRLGTIFTYRSGCSQSKITRLGSEDLVDIPQDDHNRQVFPLDLAQALRGAQPPRRILIVGLGRGDQAFVLKSMYPKARVEVVELFPSIVEAQRSSGARLAAAMLDKIELQIGDGRRFINKASHFSQGQYDLIQVGVLNVFAAGAGSLFTVQAMQSLKQLLSPTGVLVFRGFPPAVRAAQQLFTNVVGALDRTSGHSHVLASDLPVSDERTVRNSYRALEGEFKLLMAKSGVATDVHLQPYFYSDANLRISPLASIAAQTDDLIVTEYFMTQRTTPGRVLPDSVMEGHLWSFEEGRLPLF